MRLCFSFLMILSAITARRSFAARDVEFEIDFIQPGRQLQDPRPESAGLEIKDREWTVPGVETSNQPMTPPEPFDAHTALRFHFDDEGPYWLDDAVWPRTRELLHAAAKYRSFSICIAIEKPSPDLY